MVEATRKAEWPPRGLATELECGPNPPSQEALRERNPNASKGQALASLTEGEPNVLKNATPGHLRLR